MLKTVYCYAKKWRLKYNAKKSCDLIFEPSKTSKNIERNINLKLGNMTIERKETVKYTGSLINTSDKTNERTESASRSMKQKLHALYNIEFNPRGMSALTNCSIWKHIILPTALYACEIWSPITKYELELLEVTQRYFTRFILQFFRRSPIESCNANVGLWSIEGFVDKMKLLLFGRLCRANSGYVFQAAI